MLKAYVLKADLKLKIVRYLQNVSLLVHLFPIFYGFPFKKTILFVRIFQMDFSSPLVIYLSVFIVSVLINVPYSLPHPIPATIQRKCVCVCVFMCVGCLRNLLV